LGLGESASYDASGNPENFILSLKDGMARAPDQLVASMDYRYSIMLFPASGLRDFNYARTNGLFPFEQFYWHHEGANVVFCDGHVAFKKYTEIYAKNETSMRLWNRDNQPHRETW
jgi:prepilin-type processing-associated H-X9-DG protein